MRRISILLALVSAINASAQTPNVYSKNCIPVYQNNCSNTNPSPLPNPGYYAITEVKTTGGILNISNTQASNAICGTTAQNYHYYTGTGKILQIAAGATCSLTVKTALTSSAIINRFAVWIDWNRDDSFDNRTFLTPTNTGELIVTNPSNNYTYGFKIPQLAKHGLTRMRIRTLGTNLSSAANPPIIGRDPTGSNAIGGHVNPCLSNGSVAGPAGNYLIVSGETEDYDVFIDNPCVKIPAVSFSNTTDKGTDVTWTPRGNELWYEYKVDQNPADPGNGNTLLKPNITSMHLPDTFMKTLKCNTKYYFHIRGVCDTLDGKNQANWYYGPWRLDSFTTDPCCDVPEVTISNVEAHTALAVWGPVTSVQNYEYQVRMDTIIGTKGTVTSSTSLTLPGLQCSRMYYFYLRALCSPTPTSDWGVDSFLTQPCLGIDNSPVLPEFKINAYPNPVKNIVTLSVLHGIKHSDAAITVTDIAGRTVLTAVMAADKINIDLNEQAPGIYFVKYADEERTQVVRISKE